MPLYLGIDGGGTKTAACIIDESGRELGRGEGGPCNIISCPADTLRASIVNAAASAAVNASIPHTRPFEAVCAGVAGYTSTACRREFQEILAQCIPARSRLVEPDFTIGWWGATGGSHGVVCIAGTGAVAYGRNSHGASHRVDGRGFLLGDWGSGFDIGRRALIETLNEIDGGRPRSLLYNALCEQLSLCSADRLVEWTNVDFDPARIAGLAPIVGQAAQDGDERAIRIITYAAGMLRESVEEIFDRLVMSEKSPVYTLGGLWKLGDLLLNAFRDGRLNVQPARHDSAYGAALLAMRSGS